MSNSSCSECGLSKAITIYDHYGLCTKLAHKVRCMIWNCAMDPETPACEDFERVR